MADPYFSEKDKEIVENIQLLVDLMKVKSSVKDNVTQDYTLAFFNKDEKEYVSENYQNAEYAKELINRFGYKGYFYKFDDKNGKWMVNEEGFFLKVPLTDAEKKIITFRALRIFEFFMVHPHMIAILNRNKSDNFLVKLLGKQQDEKEEPVGQMSSKGFFQRIKEKLSGKGEEDETD